MSIACTLRSGRFWRDGLPMLLVRGQMSDLVSQERADEFSHASLKSSSSMSGVRDTWSPATATTSSRMRCWTSSTDTGGSDRRRHHPIVGAEVDGCADNGAVDLT